MVYIRKILYRLKNTVEEDYKTILMLALEVKNTDSRKDLWCSNQRGL
jgi:hypothetical protein